MYGLGVPLLGFYRIKEHLTIAIRSLTSQTGVYQFFDKQGRLLYVGKAKNIKKRVRSYFQKKVGRKTAQLLSRLHRIETIVVNTETDALLLEQNLIKNHQPKYNILLKDDKSYPWICIKNEAFPRVFLTRRRVRDGSEYFGPYTSVKRANAMMSLIKSLYPLRTCDHDLSTQKIQQGKYKVCLDYHIGNCLGVCEEKQDSQQYQSNIASIRQLLKGNFSHALKIFKEEMMRLASNQAFEQAQDIKEKLMLLSDYQAKSTVVNPKIGQATVLGIISDEAHSYVHYLKIVNGCIVQTNNTQIKKIMQESEDYLLSRYLIALKNKAHFEVKQVLLPMKISESIDGLRMVVPKSGDKKKLVELAVRNAKHFRQDILNKQEARTLKKGGNATMLEIKKTLGLKVLPKHIECFDNSNIQGTHPVASCVVFKNAKPAKKDYRHFHIKTVVGPDDFASMEEVVFRRYQRLLEEKKPLPQLVVIDGGKGQLSAAVRSLTRLNLRNDIAIIGIAKKLERLYKPNDSLPLYLKKTNITLKIIQQLRDEAHRFGLSFHRKIRGDKMVENELLRIPGIGEKTAVALLGQFGSVLRVKQADESALTALIGRDKMLKIKRHFESSKD